MLRKEEIWYCLKMCRSRMLGVYDKIRAAVCIVMVSELLSLLIATMIGSALAGFILYVAVGSQ